MPDAAPGYGFRDGNPTGDKGGVVWRERKRRDLPGRSSRVRQKGIMANPRIRPYERGAAAPQTPCTSRKCRKRPVWPESAGTSICGLMTEGDRPGLDQGRPEPGAGLKRPGRLEGSDRPLSVQTGRNPEAREANPRTGRPAPVRGVQFQFFRIRSGTTECFRGSRDRTSDGSGRKRPSSDGRAGTCRIRDRRPQESVSRIEVGIIAAPAGPRRTSREFP